MLEQVTQQRNLLTIPYAASRRPRFTTDTLDRFVPIVVTLMAVVLWSMSATQIDINAMNDYGLVSVMPFGSFVALLMITLSFCTTIGQQRFDKATLAVHFLALIFMLYGLTSMIEPIPRFHVAWRHIGIIDNIARARAVDPWISAYFNWPSYFILNVFLIEATGISDPLEWTRWAPAVQNVIYFGPLYLIFIAGSTDRRLAWLAMWFFYIANWVSQDYFAPQGLSYFLYLIILGVLLQWFRGQRVGIAYIPDEWLEMPPVRGCLNWFNGRFTIDNPVHAYAFAGQRMGLLVIVVLIFAAIVPSHQLTPIFTIGCVGLLVLFNRCTVRELPVLMIVLTVTWIMFMAIVFMSGHLDMVFGGLGDLDENVSKGILDRINGSFEHVVVVLARMFMTVAIGILAMFGALRRLRNGIIDLSFGILIVTPFVFVAVQPYAGEMIIRSYLFALPGMCFLAAALFYPTATTRGGAGIAIGVGLVTLVLGSGFLLARYGNERMDYYTHDEVAGIEAMYEMAEPGSLLIISSEFTAWKHRDLENYKYKVATPATQREDVERFIELMTNPEHTNAYYILTRSQLAYSELFLGDEPGQWTHHMQKLLDTGLFKTVVKNKDAHVVTLRDRDALMSQATE